MCNVVIADDEYLEREAIKRIAGEIDGARIVGEGNCGRLALELCAALKPDLVIINCHMGGMDGFEAARKIRAADSNVRIVMTTADEQLLPRRDLSALDIDEYLLKPIRPEKIREILIKNLKTLRSTKFHPGRYKKRNLRFYPNQIMAREITRALLYIDGHYRENISLKSIADMVSLSSYYFSRLFKKEVGVNFSDFVLHKRLSEAKQLLEETDKSILEISTLVGFQEQSYFCKAFKKHIGMTPSHYRKTAAGIQKERRAVKEKYQ